MADNGYGVQDVNFGRYNKAVLNIGKKVLKDIMLVIFYRVTVYIGLYPANLRKLFCIVLQRSSSQFRKHFNNAEIATLEENVEDANMDVTLCFKVIQYFNFPCPDLFPKIKALKDLRNRVCHTDVVMDSAKLITELQDFKDQFTEVLVTFGNFVGENFNGKIKSYSKEVDAIHTGSIHDDFSSYMNGLYNFQNDLKGRMIVRGRQELMNLYSKFSILNPCSWINDSFFENFTIDKIYTPLEIISSTHMFIIEDMLEDKMYKEIGNSRSVPNVICVIGLPGSGKTALCVYILQEWCRGSDVIKNLNSLDLVLHVEIRHICSNNLNSFLRNQLLKETSLEFQEEDLVPILLQTNIMIILDGMDECTSESKKVVKEFFATFGQERILITTRQEHKTDISNLANDLRLSSIFVQVCGFSHNSLHLFIKKAFQAIESDRQKCQKDIDSFSNYIESTGKKLGILMELPLNVMLLVVLWHEKSDRVNSVTTATRLYYELFLLCKAKLVKRLKNSRTAIHNEKSVTEFMTYLGEIALEMLQQDRLVLDKERKNLLMEKCESLSIGDIETLSSFLSYESHGHLDVENTFAFLHKSQMEYFAGLYISETFFSHYKENTPQNNRGLLAKCVRSVSCFFLKHWKVSGVNALDILKGGYKKYANIIMYITGHLVIQEKMTSSNANLIVEYLKENVKVEVSQLSTWWQVLWEAENHRCMKMALSGLGLKDDVIFNDSHFRDKSSPELEFIMSTSQSVGIIIELASSVFPSDESDSSACLELVEKKYPRLIELCRQLLNVKEEISLCLYYHYYTWGDMMLNDCILTTFMPRESLKYFLGHLGKDGIGLLRHTRIQNLFVRVSSHDVLKELVLAVNKVSGLEVLELRLDYPLMNVDLPVITQKCRISVKIRDVTDNMVSSVIKVLISLGNTYDHVDLVASQLTVIGGEQLLLQLLKNKINIATAVIIRTRHSPQHDKIEEFQKALNCNIYWWW